MYPVLFFSVFDLDDDFDEESAVHEVVYNMLERDVVNLNSINDESKFKTKRKIFEDPTTKMKLRHEQVKGKSGVEEHSECTRTTKLQCIREYMKIVS